MGTDKTHVGFVSENRHDFVGFSLPTQTDTNTFINRHGVGFSSVFVGFLSVLGQDFQQNKGQIWYISDEFMVARNWKLKIFINKRLNLLFNFRVHLLSLFIKS